MAFLPLLLRDLVDDFMVVPSRISQLVERSLLNDEELLELRDKQPERQLQQSKDLEAAKAQRQLVKSCKDGFSVNVDVSHFQPEELSIKQENGWVTIEGKHEERRDHHGFVSRHFVRKYRLPEGHDNDKLVSTLSSDGILTIMAPKLALEDKNGTGKRAKEDEDAEGTAGNDAKKAKL